MTSLSKASDSSRRLSPLKKSEMFDNLGDKSITSVTTDFSVHTGPIKLHTPLGLSVSSTEHYIKPVPPMYVTEYESAYQWPHTDASSSPKESEVSPSVGATGKERDFEIKDEQDSCRHLNDNYSHDHLANLGKKKVDKRSDEKRHYEPHDKLKGHSSLPIKDKVMGREHIESKWKEMEECLSKLTFLGHDKTASQGALSAIHDRQLAPAVCLTQVINLYTC